MKLISLKEVTAQIPWIQMRKLMRKKMRRITGKIRKARCKAMADSVSKEMTAEEIRDFIETIPEGTVVSIEVKVVLEDG